MIELKLVPLAQKEVLRNLPEKYNYEFSQYTLYDINELSLYGYDYLDCYWSDEHCFPYFIYAEHKLAGFVLVNNYNNDPDHLCDFAIAEFFVLYKYRKHHVGKQSAFQVFDLHHCSWHLMYHPRNIASLHFWNNIVNEYTDGNYKLIENHPKVTYDNGTHANLLYFNN